jgi:hypothetical protein
MSATPLDEVTEVLARHQYALGHDGIVADGEVAWLHCTCGWRLNYEMPEDDLRLAEGVWDQHRAEAIVEALQDAASIRRAQALGLGDGSNDAWLDSIDVTTDPS